MHTSSLLSLLTIIFSIQVIGSHLVAVVAAQTRPDWQADIVLRCGTNVPGVVVINSALNETYLIRPPPAAPTRLSLPEGSRVINARPANDRTGEVGYQLRDDSLFLLEYANGTRKLMRVDCRAQVLDFIPRFPQTSQIAFIASDGMLLYVDGDSQVHYYEPESNMDTVIDTTHAGSPFRGIYRCSQSLFYLVWDHPTSNVLAVLGATADAVPYLSGSIDLDSGFFSFNNTCGFIMDGSIYQFDDNGAPKLASLNIQNSNLSNAVTLTYTSSTFVKRVLPSSVSVPCLIDSLTGIVSCENPSTCQNPSEETITGSPEDKVFFKCHPDGSTVSTMYRYSDGATMAVKEASVTEPKFYVSFWGPIWILSRISGNRRAASDQFNLHVWDSGSLISLNTSIVINDGIVIPSPFDNVTSIITLVPAVDGALEPQYVYNVGGSVFGVASLGEFAGALPPTSGGSGGTGGSDIILTPGALLSVYNGTVILSEPGRYYVNADSSVLVRGSLIALSEAILEVRGRGHIIVMDDILLEDQSRLELRWKGILESKKNTTLGGSTTIDVGVDPANPVVPIVVGETITLGGSLVIVAQPDLQTQLETQSNATVVVATHNERVGTFSTVTVSGITVADCDRVITTPQYQPTTLNVLLTLEDGPADCSGDPVQGVGLPGWAIAVIVVGIVLALAIGFVIAVALNPKLRARVLPFKHTIEG